MSNSKLLKALPLLLLAATARPVHAQSLDVDNLKDNFSRKNLIKLNGGIAANALFYNGDGETQREPFTWYLNGNLNARLFNTIDLPFSFSLTNVGAGFNYPTPPSRLGFHPTYKWATGHIGDVAMTFSPYTLNGHQFTGVGVDLNPSAKLSASAMYGRLQRGVSYDTANHSSVAAYRRMGYGAKIMYKEDKWRLGYIIFGAKDDAGSIGYVPDSLDITPKQNLVMSMTGAYRIMENLEINAEYATSALTSDKRDTSRADQSGEVRVLKPFVRERGTTAYYKAIRAALNYTIRKTIVGVGYERVDPGYQTLGAYFFNNDLENYTVNITHQLLRDKMVITGNFGFQRDDLDGNKTGSNKRIVGAVNLSYLPNDRLNLAGSYSNFQTHMYIKPQFETINQIVPNQNFDTLNFSQISQNAMVNASYTVGKSKTRIHGINANLTFFDATDKQGGEVRNGGSSQFYNAAVSYYAQFIPENVAVSLGANVSYNTIGKDEFSTYGPIGTLNARLFKKRLGTVFSTSYNISSGSAITKTSVINVRFAANYTFFKRHNLSLGILDQTRNSNAKKSHDRMTTLSYGFNF